MADSRECFDQNRNTGFSLVELIIVVSILAIAAIPLMKSMSLASRTNAKAQSMQNATSLAESVMEEMKSTPLDVLKSRYSTDFSGDVMTITKSGVTATQGEVFTATVTIDRSTYAAGDESTDAQTVLAANKKKLPRIEEIDTNSQAVLSSAKELNRYDSAAQSFFNAKKLNTDDDPFDPADPTTYAVITSKTVDIVKKTAPGSYPGVTVTATITYEDDATPKNKYVRELYTGSFVAVKKDGSSVYDPFDSNIYIFYTKGALAETININDSASVSIPPGEGPTDSHRIYFIRQVLTDADGPLAINFSGAGSGSFSYADIDDLTDGNKQFGNIELITNLGSNVATAGHIYKEEARTRVYDITVVLTKSGDATEYARLNSTITASDEITPTPTPP